MFFNIDSDDGRAIRGWIVLDDPTAAPKLMLVAPDRPELPIAADLHRADIQDMGLHPTGHVGFEIDESVVADLADRDELWLVEAQSRLLIFRRSRPCHVKAKLFIFDASAMPQNNLLRELSGHFTNVYFHCERLSPDTMLSIIKSRFFQSTLLYGRSRFSQYSPYLSDAGFTSAALLQDPFLELAERLLTLKLCASGRLAQTASMSGLERVLGFVQELKLNDEKAMLQAFRRLDPDQRELFANPMTRLFGCEAGETPQRRHVSIALEALAGVDVVGARSQFPLFARMVAAAVGADVFGAQTPVALEMVAELAHKLSRVGVVEDLLDGDRQLYEFVESATRGATDGDLIEIRRDTQSI